ncbi:MAG: hypothetical protein ACXW2C_05630 [Acidimicrobiia bacterium]
MEDGVACAIRSFVPLVVTGPAETNPYGPWTTATVEEGADVVGVCAAAATAPLARHSRVASDRLREVLVHHDVAAADTADVEVTRRNGRLRILLRFPNDVPQGVCEAAATHVLASVHALDPAARGTDVSITTIGP